MIKISLRHLRCFIAVAETDVACDQIIQTGLPGVPYSMLDDKETFYARAIPVSIRPDAASADSRMAGPTRAAFFSQKAMEDNQISSFEKEVGVVSFAAWVALGGIAALVIAATGWSFAGEISTKVAGNCIFTKVNGLVELPASAAGRVSDVSVKPGDQIRKGDTLAMIAQPDLEDRIRRARSRLEELGSRTRDLSSLSKRGVQLSDDVLRQRSDFLKQQIALAQSRVGIATDQNATSRQLLADGLVTRRVVEDAARALKAAEIAVRDLSRQFSDIERNRTGTLKRESDERSSAELELSEARRELSRLENENVRSTAIVSAFDGRVIEVKVGRGMLVSRETPLISVERSGAGGLQVVMFVPAGDGKKIAPGAEAHLVPAVVRREEHGHVFGTVSYVSDYPATPKALLSALGSEELVRDLASVAAPYEIRIDLDTGTGAMRWSRSAADRPELGAGTLCRGEIIVRRERPVGLAIPALKRESS